MTSLDHLFAPLALGPAELGNRIVSTAHQTTLVHDHLPSDAFVAYHRARARGGVGLIVLEATAVHPSGLLTRHTLGGYLPELATAYRRVADAVHECGTRVFVQLFHGGREQISTPPRAPAIAPSAIPSQRFRVEPRSARPAELEEIVAGYARAAEIAAEGGLDGVEISAAHRYLIEQFFDPELNRRTDGWSDGARFLIEVLTAVRRAVPGLTLGVRLSADSPHATAIARALTPTPIDYLSLALGDSSSYRGSVGIVPPPPIEEDAVAERTRPFRNGVPLITTSRIVDPVSADRLIARGVTEATGMTRALIADPDLPAKARRGRAVEIIRCIGCNACIAHYHAATPIACAVNPRTGRESQFGESRPGRGGGRRRLVVAGGGPAGIAAAVEAGLAGHEVVLLEREERLGGQIALAAAAPGSADVAQTFAENAEHRLELAGVDVRLGSAATVDGLAGLAPDAVVVATGARPYRDDRLELEGVDVLQAWDVLAGAIPTVKRIVVADWGGDPGGLDAAELLAAAGNEVTIGIASVAVGETIHQYRRNLYLRRLYAAGVVIVHHVALARAADGVVVFRNVFAPDRDATLVADLVVLAQGRVPDDTLHAALTDMGMRVEDAGDCRSPRSLEEAVLEGTLAARLVVA